jgi:hypothetical protein
MGIRRLREPLLRGLVGLFERAYNHTAKQVLHLVGTSEESLRRLFPVKFEVTGMLTFVASLGVAWSLWSMARYGQRL